MAPKNSIPPDWSTPFEPFPSNDVTAAKEWFTKEVNNNFTKWQTGQPGLSATEATCWSDLERVLQLVTGKQKMDCNKVSRNAMEGILDANDTSKKPTPLELAEIGKKTAAAHLASIKSTCAWKDNCEQWITTVCNILAARSAALWKKERRAALSKTGTSSAASADGKSVTGLSATGQGSQKRTPKKESEAESSNSQQSLKRPHPDDDGNLPERKKVQRQTQHGDSTVGELACTELVERNILVEPKYVGELMDLAEDFSFMVVGISSIVEERVHGDTIDIIGEKHLQYDKFCQLLQSRGGVFDLKTGVKELSWQISDNMPLMPISSAKEFCRALSLMHWQNRSREAMSIRLNIYKLE